MKASWTRSSAAVRSSTKNRAREVSRAASAWKSVAMSPAGSIPPAGSGIGVTRGTAVASIASTDDWDGFPGDKPVV
ncbi:MAG: hypothetical protein BWY91_02636 [bacterium ADurb.BinA028]|nr:MAG: hypothetical protein BWY91_02636 [bacterium ADurb.BinA028]